MGSLPKAHGRCARHGRDVSVAAPQRQQNLWFTGPANIQYTLLFVSYHSFDLAIHLGEAQTPGKERVVVAVGVV